jgi:hypothetical protein
VRDQRRPLLAAGSAVVVLVYVLLGWGFHGLQSACYESRHSIDHEPSVGGPLGAAAEVALWPLMLAFSGGQSCDPLPLGTK